MKRRFFYTLLAIVLTALVFVLPVLDSELSYKSASPSETVDKASKSIVDKDDQTSKREDAPRITENGPVTYLVKLQGDCLLDTVIQSGGRYGSVKELLLSAEGKSFVDIIKKDQAIVKASVQKLVSGSDFTGCRTYSAVMNGFTVKAPADSLSKLQAINGVSSVTASMQTDRFFTIDDDSGSADEGGASVSEGTSDELLQADTAYPSRMTEAYKSIIKTDAAYKQGYNGEGVLIAVLDSEFNVYHRFFAAKPLSGSLEKSELSKLFNSIGFNTDTRTAAAPPFVSNKIVYAYDYAESDTDTMDASLEHGTAIAAAAAGNNGLEDETAFRGVAYEAQLALMKISKGRDSSDIIITEPCTVLAALDDSVKLGADVICMGFGEYRESVNAAIYRPVTEKLSKAGVYIVCPSGNGSFNGSSAGLQSVDTRDIDYAAENYLSYLEGVLTFGSTNNTAYEEQYILLDGSEVDYTQLCDVSLESAASSEKSTMEYICLDADGKREDYQKLDIKGKLAIINRSELAPEKVYENAVVYEAAALAVISDDGTDGYALPEDTETTIPFIMIDSKWSEKLQSKPKGFIGVSKYGRYAAGSERISVREHTSYASFRANRLAPRTLACGDMVYSASANGGSGYYSGSSAACAQGAGICALFCQQSRSSASQGRSLIAETAKARLLSCAEPVKYGRNTADEQLYYSPRLQGSGIADIEKALGSDAYITNAEGAPFSENLGDSTEGTYSFSFVINNTSGEERSYKPSVVLQTDRSKTDSEGKCINTMKPYSLSGNAGIRFESGGRALRAVTVPAGERVTVDVSIRLDPAESESLMSQFPMGFYIDGFLLLTEKGGSVLHGAFTAFCGQLETLQPFDNTVYDYDASISGFESSLCAAAVKNGEPSYCTLRQEDGMVIFSNKAISSFSEDNAYGSSFILPDMNYLRDVYEMKVSILDEGGSTLASCELGNVGAYRDSDRAPRELLVGRAAALERFFAELPDGSYQYKLSGRVMAAGGELSGEYSKTIPFSCDSVKPTELSSRTYVENGRLILELNAKDRSGISGFVLYATAYDKTDMDYRYADRLSELIAAGFISENAYTFLDKKLSADGSAVFRYDVTNLSQELMKLKLHTSTWINKSSSQKIAYKAVDNAYNESEARIADAIVYGTATFVFTDQNGKPAGNISVTLDGRKLTSDRTGTVTFDKLKPDYYYAFIQYDSEKYKAENESFIVRISNEELTFSTDEKVEFLGRYEDEEPQLSESPEEKKLIEKETSQPDDAGGDNPLYAILFVCTLLAVCGIAMILRMRHTNREPENE